MKQFLPAGRASLIATSVAAAVTLVLGCHSAMATEVAGANIAKGGHSTTLSLDILAQPINTALNEFARQSGLQVFFLASDQSKQVMSNPVAGHFEPSVALARMLANTGLRYEYIDSKTVAIFDASSRTASQQYQINGMLAGGNSAQLAAVVQAESTAAPSSTDGTLQPRLTPEMIDRLEQVIVTAQKQEEKLLSVPVPVTVLSATSLADKSQFRIQDYYSAIPGVSIAASELAPTVAIRGIISAAGANPNVGVILDDMPLGSATGIGGGYFAPELDPADLARIEVLRGPQGTLYGASSMGGLLKYVTVDPSVDVFSGRIQIGANTVVHGGVGHNLSGSVNVPLSDNLAVRVSGFNRHEGGYIDNVRPGGSRDVNEIDLRGGRVSVLWKPNDALAIKLAALYQSNELSGFAYVTRENPPLGDLEQSFVPNSGGSKRTFSSYSANINYDGDVFKVASITGYGESKYTDVLDYSDLFGADTLDLLGTPNALDFDDSKTYKFTQEVRLSTSFGDHLDWLVGAYYGNEKSPYRFNVFGTDDNGVKIGELMLFDYKSTLREKAGFTNFTVRFSDQFDVQLGGRHAKLEQSFEEVDTGIILGPFSPSIFPKYTFDESTTTYLLTPRYKISGDSMIYARIATGYRPGGVNTAGLTGSSTYSPDKTTNYEVGIKGTALNSAFSYDASIYRINWSDIQLTLIDPDSGLGYFVNGGSGRSQGIEFAVQVAPTDQLKLDGWITFIDATLTQDMPENAAHGLKGDRLPYSPKWSGHIAGDYQFSVADHIAHVGADFSYVGNRVADFLSPGEARERFSSYTLLNLSSELDLDQWTMGLYLNNVGDKRGVTGGGAGSTIPRAFQVIQPRTLGFSLSRSF